MMRVMRLAALYTALALGANASPGLAAGLDGLLTGDMKKLAVHASPIDLPAAELLDMTDGAQSLDQFKGKWVVLNFWATWCAPCRKEMPALDRLQTAMPDIVVLPLATGRNPPEQITRFFAEAEVKNLTVLRDPQMGLARAMGVLGLPVTVILNPEGQEIARLIGDAEWDSAEAQAVLAALGSQ